jgi:uncharacterized membrane protein YdjX (TVP38/TMEM64 family)
MQNKWKIVAGFSVVVAVIALVRLSPLGSYITLENLKQNRDALVMLVQSHYSGAAAGYVVLYAVLTAFSVPGAAVMTMAGGFLFGVAVGSLLSATGATMGAAGAFLSSRYVFGRSMQAVYGSRLESFNASVEKNGVRYLLALRLIPVFPFFLINILAGLTRISFVSFLWTTAIGIIPGTVAFSFAGRRLGSIESVHDVLSGKVIVACAILAVVILLPVFIKKRAG